MDALGEIQTLIQTSGFSRAKLTALLREIVPKEPEAPRKKKPQASPVTMYRSIKREYTCLHCGKQFSSVVILHEDVDTVALTPEGKVMVINSDSPAVVSCVTSSCNWCKEFIRNLTREELEERYMILLSNISLVAKQNPFGSCTTGKEVKL